MYRFIIKMVNKIIVIYIILKKLVKMNYYIKDVYSIKKD